MFAISLSRIETSLNKHSFRTIFFSLPLSLHIQINTFFQSLIIERCCCCSCFFLSSFISKKQMRIIHLNRGRVNEKMTTSEEKNEAEGEKKNLIHLRLDSLLKQTTSLVKNCAQLFLLELIFSKYVKAFFFK